MPRLPYMNFPFPFYKNPLKTPAGFYNAQGNIINGNKANSTPISTSQLNDITKSEYINSNVEKNKSNNNTGDYLFDLFGLKIYNDDVLLVSLIYFLYSEGVKDDGLFLVLVLLLLS